MLADGDCDLDQPSPQFLGPNMRLFEGSTPAMGVEVKVNTENAKLWEEVKNKKTSMLKATQ